MDVTGGPSGLVGIPSFTIGPFSFASPISMYYLVVTLVVAIVVLVIAITAVGAMLPREHVASRSMTVHRPPQDVWPVLTGVTAQSSVPVDIIERDPPRRLVTRVKPTEKMFGGTWTCVITPTSTGSIVTVTENGWVPNPLVRFISRYMIGHYATIDATLKETAKQLDERAVLTGR